MWRQLVVLAVGLVVLASLPGAASAATTAYESTLGATEYDGNPNVFFSGVDSGLWRLYEDGAGWHGPAEIAGTTGALASAPSAMQGGSSLEEYWQDSDGGLDEAWFDGTSWHGPGEVPGTAGTLASAPSAEQNGSSVEVYWRAGDGGLDQDSFNGASWQTPTAIPGTTPTSTPSTPVTVTLPVPSASSSPAKPGTPRKAGHVRARFTITWRWRGARTRLTLIHVRGVPRHGSVSVACAGRGCPWGKKAATRSHVPRLLRSLVGHVLSAGDRLTLTVRAPKLIAERIEVRIRNGAAPAARLLRAAH